MEISKIDVHTEKEWKGFNSHFHNEEWQIDYFGQGKGRYLMGDYWLKIDKNFLFVIPPLNSHQAEINCKSGVKNFSIKFKLDEKHILNSLCKKPEKIKIKNKKIEILFKNIVGYHIIGKSEIAEKYLNDLILEISEVLENKRNLNLEEKINLAKEIVEENYFLNSLKLSFIAEKVNLNPQYLCRKYKKLKGIGIFEYIRKIRMKKGHQLVINTEEPLKKIAFDCGFKNIFYFTNSFKKYFKTTPGKLRKKLL